MPTQPYFSGTGQRLPGVTTVIGNIGWNRDNLMAWSNREGLAGRNIRDRFTTASKSAADVGTCVHQMIESEIRGDEVPKLAAADLLNALTEPEREKAKMGFGGFLRWRKQTRVVLVATELAIIDEDWQTGGCLDALALGEDDEGKPAIMVVDWKVSSGTFADHVIQIAAYTVFAERALSRWFGEPVAVAGSHCLRVDKTHGHFSHKYWPRAALEKPWAAFSYARNLHSIRYEIEALTK